MKPIQYLGRTEDNILQIAVFAEICFDQITSGFIGYHLVIVTSFIKLSALSDNMVEVPVLTPETVNGAIFL